MLFQSGDVSGGSRISLRFATVLLIPAVLIVWLLYAAQTGEEAAHGRNLRCLAQMAKLITERVQIYSDFVRERAVRPADPKPARNGSRRIAKTGGAPGGSGQQPDAPEHSIEKDLKSATCDPTGLKNLTVMDNGADLFLQPPGQYDRCAQTDLKALVKPAIRQDGFTSVILAQRDGRVLYQSQSESLRITDVSFLFARSGEERGKLFPGTAGSSAKDAQAAKDAAARSDAPTSSIHLTSQIGDVNFQVFVQPFPQRAKARPEDWILIGISEKHNLMRSSAPNSLMVILALVILLLGMSWPLQRLWSMSPFEALRRSHVVVIGLCSLGVVVILSLLVVYEYSLHRSAAQTDRQLRAFAQALGHNFSKELKLAVDQLRRLDEIAAKGKGEVEAGILRDLLKPGDVKLPFEYADWIDVKGDRTLRWTTKSTPTPAVNVFDRPYFRDVISDTTLLVPGISPWGFAIQQVVSRTSGEAVTVIGIRSGVGRKDTQVASLAVNLVSLSDPVATRDLGFAIIDNHSGDVLFHCERNRILAENLFEESQESGALEGIVSRRIPAFVNLDYDASPHRMFVTPIPGAERLPWTLVVFRKLAANQIGRVQVLVDTSALLCVYGMGLTLAVAFGWLLAGPAFRPRYTSLVRWWTALEGGRVYVAGAGFILVIVVCRAFERFHGSDLLSVAIEGGLVFLLITALGLRYPVRYPVRYPGGGRRLPARPLPAGLRRHLKRAGRRLGRVAGVPAVLTAFALSLGDWFMAGAAPAAVVLWGLLVWRMFDAMPRNRHPRMLRTAWLVWGVELALVLCMAPTLLLSRLSYEYEGGLRLRDAQLWLSTAEAQRRRAVVRAIEQTPGVEEHDKMRRKLLAAVGLLDSDPAVQPLYYYGAATTPISLFPETKAQAERCGPAAPADNGPRVPFLSKLSERVLAAIELPKEDGLMGVDARRGALNPAPNLWTWDQHGRFLCLSDSGTVQGSAPLPVFDPFDIGPIKFGPVVVQAGSGKAESGPGPGPLISSAPACSALIAILTAVALWMNTLRRRLLLMGASPVGGSADPVYDDGAPAPARLFLLTEPGDRRGALPQNLSSYRRIDLASVDLTSEEFHLDAKTAQNLPANGLLLDRFEARFQDPQVRKARLELLQAALLAEGKPIAIRSAMDCVSYLAGGGSGDPGSAADETELRCWYTLINRFERRILPPCQPIEATCDHGGYRAIWDSCSAQEKGVLMQLCRHGLVNPRATQIVAALLRRGLIQRTRAMGLRFFRPEFCQFVAGATMFVREKRSHQTGATRLPAYAIGLLLLGVVMLFSQEELTTRLIGFLTTVTGGFEAVRKHLAGIQDFGGTNKS
jgi:hypothetical protein